MTSKTANRQSTARRNTPFNPDLSTAKSIKYPIVDPQKCHACGSSNLSRSTDNEAFGISHANGWCISCDDCDAWANYIKKTSFLKTTMASKYTHYLRKALLPVLKSAVAAKLMTEQEVWDLIIANAGNARISDSFVNDLSSAICLVLIDHFKSFILNLNDEDYLRLHSKYPGILLFVNHDFKKK